MAEEQDLKQNVLKTQFDDKLRWAKTAPFLLAAREEANKLMPLFNAMAEIVRGIDVDISTPEKQRAHYPYVPWLQVEGHKALYGEELAQAFVLKAQKSGSLIVSDVTFTWSDSFVNYCLQNGSIRKFQPHDPVSHYPTIAQLTAPDTMGFLQLSQPSSQSGDNGIRISLPIKGMNANFLAPELADTVAPILADLQDVYRLANHDWLHHLTMELVNDRIIYTDFGAEQERIMYEWDDQCADSGLHYRMGNYEAWCIKAHADLMQTEAAKPLREDMAQKSLRIAKQLRKLSEKEIKIDGNSDAVFNATNYLAKLTAQSLTTVFSADSEYVRDFLKKIKEITATSSPSARETRRVIWSMPESSEQDEQLKVKHMRVALKENQGLAILFDEETKQIPFNRNKPREMLGLAGRLKMQCG